MNTSVKQSKPIEPLEIPDEGGHEKKYGLTYERSPFGDWTHVYRQDEHLASFYGENQEDMAIRFIMAICVNQ
jgi:hypothetical protein